jgi:serine/threonine-protein kinase
VAAQDPADGKAPKGSVIVLTVSKGPQILTVPNVIGMSLDAARAQLAAAGFTRVETVALPVGPSEVRSQSPGGGMQVPRTTTITLYVY